MSNYPSLAAEAGDKYLAMLAQGQEQVLEFVRSSKELMPKVPAEFSPQFPEMPFTMPSPRDLADAQFQFASKMLEHQEGFIRKLYQIPSAKTPAKAAKTAPKSTKATAAKGATARRRVARKPKSAR